MAQAMFFKVGNYEFRSDERDIRTASGNGNEILHWCWKNNIDATRIMTGPKLPYNIWRVKDEQQRMLFALRWEQ